MSSNEYQASRRKLRRRTDERSAAPLMSLGTKGAVDGVVGRARRRSTDPVLETALDQGDTDQGQNDSDYDSGKDGLDQGRLVGDEEGEEERKETAERSGTEKSTKGFGTG